MFFFKFRSSTLTKESWNGFLIIWDTSFRFTRHFIVSTSLQSNYLRSADFWWQLMKAKLPSIVVGDSTTLM